MRRVWCSLVIGLILAGCGGASVPPTPLPTLGPVLSNPPAVAPAGAALPPTPTLPAQTLAFAVTSTAEPSAGMPERTATSQPGNQPAGADGDPQSQYRRWMEEARAKHPYAASVDDMWHVMVCESSGNPAIQGPGGLTGLFQYQPSTWDAPWNPYRDQPITDARSQIFATAKAWSDGYQQWWSVCLP